MIASYFVEYHWGIAAASAGSKTWGGFEVLDDPLEVARGKASVGEPPLSSAATVDVTSTLSARLLLPGTNSECDWSTDDAACSGDGSCDALFAVVASVKVTLGPGCRSLPATTKQRCLQRPGRNCAARPIKP